MTHKVPCSNLTFAFNLLSGLRQVTPSQPPSCNMGRTHFTYLLVFLGGWKDNTCKALWTFESSTKYYYEPVCWTKSWFQFQLWHTVFPLNQWVFWFRTPHILWNKTNWSNFTNTVTYSKHLTGSVPPLGVHHGKWTETKQCARMLKQLHFYFIC